MAGRERRRTSAWLCGTRRFARTRTAEAGLSPNHELTHLHVPAQEVKAQRDLAGASEVGELCTLLVPLTSNHGGAREVHDLRGVKGALWRS